MTQVSPKILRTLRPLQLRIDKILGKLPIALYLLFVIGRIGKDPDKRFFDKLLAGVLLLSAIKILYEAWGTY